MTEKFFTIPLIKIALLVTFGNFISFKVIPSTKSYHDQCEDIKSYLVGSSYKVNCGDNYHHYNVGSVKKYYSEKKAKRGRVKIATYNLLHPGSKKSRFKDYKLMANIMNEWDLIAAVELLPIVSIEYKNNMRVKENQDLTKKQIKDLFRGPGYLNILSELRKKDPSWSLILSADGEALLSTSSHELMGYYYRAKKVKPVKNDYCKDFGWWDDYPSLACFPEFRPPFTRTSRTPLFSRRPFMASFKSGNFDFTLLATHTIFSSPSDNQIMSKFLRPVFGVSSYKSLDEGINKANYARFAEMGATLQFMRILRESYDENDIILLGDMNLESKNPFWKTTLPYLPGAKIYNEGQTTISQQKINSKGKDSKGLSSNYDHFIMDPKITKACSSRRGKVKANVFSYMEGRFFKKFEEKYLVKKNPKGQLDYKLSFRGKRKKKKLLEEYKDSLKGLKTVRKGKVIKDTARIQKNLKKFEKRVIDSQLSNKTYYKVFTEILSDHLPVWFSCNTGKKDLD